LRVLGVARKSGASLENAERGMTFLGLVGMIDPPRPEAREAVRKCGEAGIRVVMITGDHPLTAQAVARELGILKDGRVITGAQLDAFSEPELDREVDTVDVFARVSPAHKLRVVSALQKRGSVVMASTMRLPSRRPTSALPWVSRVQTFPRRRPP
jgi:Ca2+-transporting ATPase